MKPNKKILIPIVLISSLAVAGYYVDAGRAAKYSKLSGTFESRPSLLGSRAAGRVLKILVDEGDQVTEGQILAILDSPNTAAEAASQASRAEQAQHNLAETLNGPRKEEIERQRMAVVEMEAQLKRLVNGSLPEEIRAAEDRAEAAQAAYARAKNGSRPLEIEAARAAEGQAKARLDAIRRGPTLEARAQLQAAVDSAKAIEQNAAVNYRRYQSLFEAGAVSRQAFETIETTYRTAVAQRKAAEQALQRANLGNPAEEIREAQEAYRQAEANRRLIEAGPRAEDVEITRREMMAAKENLQLMKRGARSEDIEAMKARVAQGRALLDQLHNGARKEERDQARAAAQAAKAQAVGAKAIAEDRVVRATSTGFVERVLVAVGDLVGAGTPVVQVADPADIWVRVYVPEASLANIKVGDAATLRVDGVSGEFLAKVESISAKGEFTPANLQSPEERGKQVFAVRLRLKSPDVRIKAGMFTTVTALGVGIERR
ncbi:MAG: HlyD family efflux transporter periplasmic adaptor subunit [Fimbriimonadaceae bacterium]|nr:HlyD family efflux transporter periplasmic adaptor subunit [Fimbriimonadaceae bacterium]